MGQTEFEALIHEHRGILYKVSHAYARTPEDRDDLAQEITVQLWRSRGGFDRNARFSTWMYRIALNVAISFFRRESVRKRHTLPSDDRLLTVVYPVEPPSEEVALLYRFIDGLDPLNKALVLLYLDGHSHAASGEVLGLTATNVATRLNRLKDVMKREFSSPEKP